MKGLLNNQEAVNIVNRIDSMLGNRLHQIYNLGYKEGYKDGYNAKQEEIIQTLTEQILTERSAEPKTGHWIGTEYDGYADGHPVYDVYECSECGMEYDAIEDGGITHNYCPNCGEDMREDQITMELGE